MTNRIIVCWLFCVLSATLFAADNTTNNNTHTHPLWKREINLNWVNIDRRTEFNHWKQAFNKTYAPSLSTTNHNDNAYQNNEDNYRFEIFVNNWKMINDFNTNPNKTSRYTLRLNQFGDLTASEFRLYIHGHTHSCLFTRATSKTKTNTKKKKKILPWSLSTLSTATANTHANTNRSTANPIPIPIPSAIDWTNMDGISYVTPVKDQGDCGSCWAFAAIGSTESNYAIAQANAHHRNGNAIASNTHSNVGNADNADNADIAIVSLSVQELVDCSNGPPYRNDGCQGGFMPSAFQYIQDKRGLCSDQQYPYKAVQQSACKRSELCTEFYDPIRNHSNIAPRSIADLEAILVNYGPVAAAVEADQASFQFYSSGILDSSCGTELDHGVVIVGYGSAYGTPYWKIKNSWGKSWGMDGYILLCKDCGKNEDNGECGILMNPSYAIP